MILFGGTIQGKYCLRSRATDEEIEDAARKANALGYPVLPEKMDTRVGDRG